MEKSERNEKLYLLFQKLGGLYPAKGTIFLPKPQRAKELRKIFEVFQEKGERGGVYEVSKLLPEPHRTEELKKFFEACRKAAHFAHAEEIANILVCQEAEHFAHAEEIANILIEPHRTEALIKIIEDYFERGYIDKALRTAVIIPEPYRTEELVKLLEECVGKCRYDDAQKIADMILKNHQK